MDSNTLKGILLTMAGAICWGFSGTCGEYLFSQKNLDSSWLTVVRMIVAGILLILFGFNRYAYQFIGILKDKKDIYEYIEDATNLVRPINYPVGTPGKGSQLFDFNGFKIF